MSASSKVCKSEVPTFGSVVVVVISATILAFVFSFGTSISETGYFDASLGQLIFRFVLIFPMATILLLLGCYVASHPNLYKIKSKVVEKQIARLVPSLNVGSILRFTAVMVLLWMPYLIALFPGSMNWDTFYQISQWYPDYHPIWLIPWAPTESYIDNAFSDHHPIFDTIIYGAFACSSDLLFGTWNYGVFAFVLLQAFGTAAAMVASIAYLERLHSPIAIRFALLLFCCFAPFFPIYAATMLKDSLFSWLYIPYLIVIVEIVRTKGDALTRKPVLLWFFVLAILLSLTKKTGMYVVVGTAICLAIVYKAQWKALVGQAIASLVVMCLILPMVVFPILDVAPGGKQEALAPIFQQTARYVYEYGDEVTEEEKNAIDAVLGYESLAKRYDPFSADPVKFEFNYNCSTQDLLRYILIWVQQGLKHPDAYVEATLVTVAPYLSDSGTIGIHENTGDSEHAGSPLVWQPESLDGFRNTVLSIYHWLCDAPLVAIVFKVGLYACWIPLIAFCSFARHKKQWLPILIPVAFSLLSCLITPVFHARYALPMIYTAPLLVGVVFAIKADSANAGNRNTLPPNKTHSLARTA